ncbi:DUF4339 domain-containing protein [Novipirellula sp.]|uniref:DUF4339 domain-containing protein n=1 Tax=Novipirellula sp. TaxID=2795430 RepID=UPI003562CB34
MLQSTTPLGHSRNKYPTFNQRNRSNRMSDDRIYVRFKGKTLGPLTDQKVRDLVRRGQITRMHELSFDGLAWLKAEEFGDFFQSKTASAPVQREATESGVAMAPVSVQQAAKVSTPIPGLMPDDGVQWYAHVKGNNQGPINSQTLLNWVSVGDVDADTLLWRAGYDDWRPASMCLPERFASAGPQPVLIQADTASQSVSTGASVPIDLCERFISQRVWVLTISIFMFIGAGLGIVYFITAMVVGAEAKWVPAAGAASVIFGLCGLVLCGIQITGAVLLLNYASSLLSLSRSRDNVHLGFAANRLRTFWKFCSIVLIVLSVLLVGGAVLFLVMISAAAGAAT